MTYRANLLGALAVLAACVTSSCSGSLASNQSDVADITANVQHLVSALNAKDINAIMA
jgi:hypothetical protein